MRTQRRNMRALRRGPALIMFCVAALALGGMSLSGCQLTQSDFAHTAGAIGSDFAAAQATLIALHTGRVTTAYAVSSFVNYRAELQGQDQWLGAAQGAPDHAQVARLLERYARGMDIVKQPCLSEACDWRGQVVALDAASRAFLKASGA